MKGQGISSAAVIFFGAMLCSAPGAFAQEISAPLGEFSADSVRNIFDVSIRPTEQRNIEYFPAVQQPENKNAAKKARVRKAKERRARLQDQQGDEFALTSGASAVSAEQAQKRADAISEAEAQAKGIQEDTANQFLKAKPEESPKAKIIASYGDPAVDQPLSNHYEQAPKQMRAAMEAMQNDEPGLAMEYVANYMRQQQEHDEFIKDWVKLQRIYLMRKGEISPGTSPCAGDDEEECEMFLNMRLQGEEFAPAQATSETKNMPKEFAALLAAQENKDKHALLGNKKVRLDAKALQVDEKAERSLARRNLSGRLPIDRKGKVMVYYFFDTYDKHAIAFAPEVHNLYKLIKDDSRVNFMGLTLKADTDSRIRQYRHWTKSEFPIQNGKALADALKIKISPTLVFYQHSKPDLMHVETGIKSHFYLDEILKMMQGK